MKHYIYRNVILVLLIMAISPIIAGIKATTIRTDSFEILKKNARKSESPDDWKKVVENAKARKDTADLGLAYISYLQALANMDPNDNFMEKAQPVFSFLFDTKQYDYYFALYNIFVDRLFLSKAYQKAQDEAARMYARAEELGQPVGMAMALRVQGQIFYKLNLYDKAYSSLREGLKTCPPYQDNLNTFSTAQSLCEWLFMTCLKTEAHDELLPLSDLYGDMLKYWHGQGWKDPSGHYMVTYHSLRAIALLKAERIQEAEICLDKARTYILPAFPARAYEHFYEACCMLLYREGKFKEAIAYVDTLLDTHRHYYPFFLNDLLIKAELLSLSGQPQQSIELYRNYIQANDSITKEEIASKLDELRIQYQVEKAQQENLQKTKYLRLAFIIIILIALLLSLYIVYARKLNAKNRLLVARLEEHDSWIRNFAPKGEKPDEQPTADFPGQLTSREIMRHVNAFMIDKRPYLNPSLERKELAKALQVNERALANAIREENGQTLLEYITMYRLENARYLLSLNETTTIKDIAEQCGFGTLRTFQRCFRERFGMPPSQYREIISKKGHA